jgi:uncharacterized protein YndB with AHSA1/START domain
MTASTATSVTTQVYRVYIRATPQAIWDAITDPEWSEKYGYGGRVGFDPDFRPGSHYEHETSAAMRAMGSPNVAIDGEIVEADPPHKLVVTWRMVMDEAMAAEGYTRLTYEIVEGTGGVTKLTLIHDLEGAPKLQLLLSGGMEDQGAGGGWNWVLSDIKSLLETGKGLDWQNPLNQG